jgi:hypothetical protein
MSCCVNYKTRFILDTGFEWEVLDSVIKEGEHNTLPLQIAFEAHYGRPSAPRGSSGLSAWFRKIYNKAGYAVLDRHDNNPECFYCTELLLGRFC